VEKSIKTTYMEWKQWHNGIRKIERALWRMKMVVTPLGGVGESKMNGEEPPLEMYYIQDKTKIRDHSRLTKHFDKVYFLFIIQGPNTRGKTPYL